MNQTHLKAEIAFASDKGIKEENEDFYGSSIPPEPQLTHKGITAAIADGMSGSDAGKEASRACIIGFISDYNSTPDSWSAKHAGQKILSATNSWLYSQGLARYQSTKGMVSTLSILIIKSTTAHIFHIGDSRIYRLRRGNLELMTRDHRFWVSDEKNYLNRAMGIEPRLEVDYKSFPVEKNDLFLMTTDGIHDFVDDKFIKSSLLKAHENLDTTAQEILEQGKKNQSDDNLTCQLVYVTELPQAQDDEILRRHANLPFPPILDAGMVIDGFRIEAELHASKRTQIYRAYDTINERLVILKTPSLLYDDDTHYIEHFLHEEWAGKRIQNKNVLKVLETDRKKSCIYYVVEYIDGPTLRQWMKDNPKPLIRDVRKIAEQLCKGLRAFHRLEMLHQDLKPENIMFDHDGKLKIIDFGSVKIAGIAEITPLDHGEQENILGTLNYTAPEYHFGQRGTVSSDLYSVGVLVYEMLNQSLPFGQDMPEKPNKMNLSKLEYVPSFHNNPMVPIWIDGAIKKACSINPQARYNDLFEFLHDLNKPNKDFLKGKETIPLIEQNPLAFWKTVCGVLLISNLLSLYFLFYK